MFFFFFFSPAKGVHVAIAERFGTLVAFLNVIICSPFCCCFTGNVK